MTQPAPRYAITLAGKDITPAINPRLLSLSVTDNRGFEADLLDLMLDDADGLLEIPPRGAKLTIKMGWAGEDLTDLGEFIADEIEHSGTPDVLTLRAKSADLRGGLAEKKETSWHGKTIGQIVAAVAKEHDLTPKVATSLASIVIGHIDQTNESDANLLSRIAHEHDAICTVKKGMLLFCAIGEAESVTGVKFPTVTLERESGDSHRFVVAERDTYTGVKAYYQDAKGAHKGEVIVDKKSATSTEKNATQQRSKKITASVESVKTLRHTYASKSNAERAAKAEWQRIQRGYAQFSLKLAHGRPDIFCELPVTVSGYKPEIDSESWIVTKATHTLNDAGLVSMLELELLTKNDDNTAQKTDG